MNFWNSPRQERDLESRETLFFYKIYNTSDKTASEKLKLNTSL